MSNSANWFDKQLLCTRYAFLTQRSPKAICSDTPWCNARISHIVVRSYFASYCLRVVRHFPLISWGCGRMIHFSCTFLCASCLGRWRTTTADVVYLLTASERLYLCAFIYIQLFSEWLRPTSSTWLTSCKERSWTPFTTTLDPAFGRALLLQIFGGWVSRAFKTTPLTVQFSERQKPFYHA